MSVEELIALGTSVVNAIDEDGGRARLLGGIGVEVVAAPRPARLAREIEDVDVLCRRSDRKLAERALEGLGLVPDRQVNASHGGERQVWWTADGRLHVDLFLGAFRMCHVLELDERLAVPGTGAALNHADLVLTKLQIVRLTEKDVRDLGALLAAAQPEADRIADACGRDWGLFTTVDDNLAALPPLVGRLDAGLEATVAGRAERLRAAMAAAPKSRSWRMRARLGRRVRWYEEPEEVIET
jgi:hypothetical protein